MTNEQESEEVRLFKETKIKAEQGDEDAQWELGWMYYKGQGVPRDYKEAAKWFRKEAKQYRKAAEQGDGKAQLVLAERYSNGEGVPKDYAEATKWLRKAAESGYPEAQYHLGRLYAQGVLEFDVSKDIVEAHKWWSLAAAQGHEKASEERDKIVQDMTEDQIAEAERRVREWTKK